MNDSTRLYTAICQAWKEFLAMTDKFKQKRILCISNIIPHLDHLELTVTNAAGEALTIIKLHVGETCWTLHSEVAASVGHREHYSDGREVLLVILSTDSRMLLPNEQSLADFFGWSPLETPR